ncbi:uncharacterized protein BDZ99DRAFT_493551 [Mytilinidion resinicola]|uniref:Uncharacterized protein n=1 Tax=Mytilinidion resinicola TaxID=574789 RepID=A0A6A6ZC05_9PEZI|nr:uncharacterized protein BDZ99DRAFT_493551 [Mytilinidion resinicola]KAF2817845.1 hypothetical protein BDZ99DRAFT_493551 [Mytilinidion resinicola]
MGAALSSTASPTLPCIEKLDFRSEPANVTTIDTIGAVQGNPEPANISTIGSIEAAQGNPLDFLAHGSRYVPMFDEITRHLEPSDILTLRKVNRTLAENDVFSAAMNSQWNVDTALAKFFKDAVGFRNALGHASAVVTGDFALRFLDRRAPGERIDIFMSIEEPNKYTIIDFLSEEGYDACGTYRHPAPMSKKLWTHYTTALANIITATKAYVPFAESTIKQRRSYQHALFNENDDEMSAALRIVSESGRELRDIETSFTTTTTTTASSLTATLQYRTLNDSKTWIIPFRTDELIPPKQPDFVIEATDFSVQTETNYSHGCDRYIMDLAPLDFVGLEYRWAGLWLRDARLLRQLHAALTLEIAKLPRADRPVDLANFRVVGGSNTTPGKFKPPKWLDGMVVDWAKAISRSRRVD